MPKVLDVMLGSQWSAQRHTPDELRRYRRQRGEPIVDFRGDRRSHRADALLADTTVVDLQVLDTRPQIAHGVRVIPERHQLLDAVHPRLVVFEPHSRARPQRVKMRMRTTGDAVIPRVGRRNDHTRNVIVEQVPEDRDSGAMVLVGPAEVWVDQALDVRGQLDELLAFVSGNEPAGFDRLAPELLVTQADVEPVAQHQVSDVTPPGIHAVERIQAHARQTRNTGIGGPVAGSQFVGDELHGVKRLVPTGQCLDDLGGLERGVHIQLAFKAKVMAETRCDRQESRDECGRVGTQRHIGRDVNGADFLGPEVEFHTDSMAVDLLNSSDEIHEGMPLTRLVGHVQSHSGSVTVASISSLCFNQNMNHLVIYNKKLFGYDYIAAILGGDKKLGCKFRRNKTVPYQKLQDGDYIYFKESSGPIRGRVRVTNVENRELTDPEETMAFLAAHAQEIGITSEEQLMDIWKANVGKRYLCSWIMEAPETIEHPVYIHKNDRRAWVVNYEPTEEVCAAFLGR